MAFNNAAALLIDPFNPELQEASASAEDAVAFALAALDDATKIAEIAVTEAVQAVADAIASIGDALTAAVDAITSVGVAATAQAAAVAEIMEKYPGDDTMVALALDVTVAIADAIATA